MNGYVIGGYLVVVISLGTYAYFLVQRLRGAKRRVGAAIDGEARSASERGESR
jgi:hypothetical protein